MNSEPAAAAGRSGQAPAGSVAIVTGAAKGLGRAITHSLAADGVDIVLTGRSLADLERQINSTDSTLGFRNELEARHKSGRIFPVEVALGEVQGDGVRRFTATFHDKASNVLSAQLGQEPVQVNPARPGSGRLPDAHPLPQSANTVLRR